MIKVERPEAEAEERKENEASGASALVNSGIPAAKEKVVFFKWMGRRRGQKGKKLGCGLSER